MSGLLLGWVLTGSSAAFAADQSAAPRRGVVFLSLDLMRAGGMVSTGSKFAPWGGRDKPGWRVLTMSSVAFRERDAQGFRQPPRGVGGRALVGYEWHAGAGAVSLYAGAGLVMPDVNLTVPARRRIGPVILAEFWRNWNGESLGSRGHTSGTLLADAAQQSLFLRLRHGFGLPWDGVSAGPEASLSLGRQVKERGAQVQDHWRKLRLGGHISGIPLGGRVKLGVSAGIEFQHRHQPAAYAGLLALIDY